VNLASALRLARQGSLYPSVILHGGSGEARREGAWELARTLLCEAAESERPCGVCRHCRRIGPGGGSGSGDSPFHPDVAVLERDLRTATSVDATKGLLRGAQVSPFEARGQVFVVASAESLSGEAANALLKSLEEPYLTSPRHFLLLAPSQFDLLPTLRSRSLGVYLGGSRRPAGDEVGEIADAFASAIGLWTESGSEAALLSAAAALEAVGGWDDPRAAAPWERAAETVLVASRDSTLENARRCLLALAEDLLAAPRMRLRGIPARRILEGLVHRRLAGAGGPSLPGLLPY
jgi:DNA polymerase III, delta subunit